MICASCGAEIAGTRRFCPKCGMPMTDCTVRPKEDEIKDKVSLSKEILKDKPEVMKIREERERKKEEERKKRELEEAAKSRGFDDEEELIDPDEEELMDPEYEEELSSSEIDKLKKSGFLIMDEDETDEPVISKMKPRRYVEEDEEFEVLVPPVTEPKVFSVSQVAVDILAYENDEIQVKGVVCYSETTGEVTRFNLEDEDDSLSCVVDLNGIESVEYEGMTFTKEDILNIVSTLRNGDELLVTGIPTVEENGDSFIQVLMIEGNDFLIRCRE